MTDDSASMKSALKNVWPSAKQLLCHFHVAQAHWRWLLAKNNGVSFHDRQELMKGFQKVCRTYGKGVRYWTIGNNSQSIIIKMSGNCPTGPKGTEFN